MSRGKPLNVQAGSLTETEKPALEGIIQEPDNAGEMKGRQATGTETVLDIFYNEMTEANQ